VSSKDCLSPTILLTYHQDNNLAKVQGTSISIIYRLRIQLRRQKLLIKFKILIGISHQAKLLTLTLKF